MCDSIRELSSRVHVLILQHPQEPDQDLGSARIANLALPNSTLRIGLSWPNLKAALGREAQPSRWAVLYLGSGIKSAAPRTSESPSLVLVDKKANPLPDSAKLLRELEGIVLLDGTWSQAKAIWWRNAWLLKLRRAVLTPSKKSLYGELRKEPRRDCLSTIESIAEALSALGEKKATSEGLRDIFSGLLNKQRERLKARAMAKKDTPAPSS